MQTIRHFTRHRPRLTVAVVVGALIGFLLPSTWDPVTRGLIGWNFGVWSYLASIGWLVATAKPAKILQLAEQEDRSAAAVLVLLSIASLISIAAIVLELASSRDLTAMQRFDRYAFTAATVLGSWLLVGVIFSFHYAHMYFRAHADRRPLVFPGNEPHPDYWDFLYFSFTIAVAAQTSDVTVVSREMRKVVLVQSVLSFLFNVAIVGLSINIAAGLIGA